jgi:glutamate-5-semialdehyde dehydrogenase
MKETTVQQIEIITSAKAAREASLKLSTVKHPKRAAALHMMAEEIERSGDAILKANEKDVELAQKLLQSGSINLSALKRLSLNREKLNEITNGIRQVADLPDPVGQTLLARELDQGLVLHQITCPVGVIAVIFESRPDALPQIISLCVKSANAAILKGGKEAEQTNLCMFKCIQKALEQAGLDPSAFALTHKREHVQELLNADKLIDLIIPRGSNELVRYIMDNTRIPVLGHAAGICHILVDAAADQNKALAICLDAKTNYPAACNSVETILVHQEIARQFLPQLLESLSAAEVECRCDKNLSPYVELSKYKRAKQASPEDFGIEYSDLIVAIKVVDKLDQAISHINEFGSNHTDAIITENQEAAEKFFAEVNSAGVFHNASTRFADGFRYGFGAEVGISNGKLHPRGPVGLEGLVTYKYRVVGDGHIAKNYTGKDAKKFTHKNLLNKDNK